MHEEYFKKYSNLSRSKGVCLYRTKIGFSSRKKLKDYVKEEFLKYQDEIIDENHNIYNLCKDLIELHPSYDIERSDMFLIKSRKNIPDVKGQEPFRTYTKKKEDEEWKCFAWSKCCMLTKVNENKKLHDIIRAMRCDINEQIEEYRKNNNTCIKCGSLSYIEIDHVEPEFNVIRKSFCEKYDVDEIQHINDVDSTIKDENIRAKWKEFHKKKAVFQTLCRGCHILKRKY